MDYFLHHSYTFLLHSSLVNLLKKGLSSEAATGRVLEEKVFLENFAKFTGKALLPELSL